jgi:hypothetical protein
MGKLVSWGLMDHESKYCMICGMLKSSGHGKGFAKKNCCKDELKMIRTAKDQKVTSSNALVLKSPSTDLSVVGGESLPVILFSFVASTNHWANAPPGLGQVSLYLLNRNFRV